MLICACASAIGLASSFDHRSMNACAMPNASVNASPLPLAWRVTKSARTFEERCATSPRILATSVGSGAWSISCVLISASCSPVLRLCADEPDDTVGTGGAPDHAIVHQIVQMGNRLAHGEESLVVVELAPEQRADDVSRALRLAADLFELAEPQTMMLLELRHALAHAPERQPVRRQHQRARLGERDQAPQAAEEEPQRVGVRIDLVHADVG